MNIALVEPIGVSEEVMEGYAQKLREKGHSFHYYDDVTSNRETLECRSKDCEIVMVANHPYPDEVIAKSEKLQMISVAFTGIDHVGSTACKEKGVMICNSAGYSDQTVAELVIGFAIDAFRRVREADQSVRSGGCSTGLTGRDLCGKTIGILGLGHIGLRTAKLFAAFGAHVTAYDSNKSEEAEKVGIEYVSFDNLLKESDIVSIHLPLKDETRGFIDAEKLALMKQKAVLINCARGPIVKAEALANALNQGQLAYACVDVFDCEPPIPQNNPLLSAKNILLTPHVAYLSEESMLRRAEIAFQNVFDYLDGKPGNVCRL